MKTIIQLESADIQKIIAEKFETSIENVKLRTKEICTGYGPAETYVNVPYCEIELTDQKNSCNKVETQTSYNGHKGLCEPL